MDKSKSKLEKIVYFVRHGQSADNVAPVFQSPDSPLNEKGKKQANSIAQRVSKLSFDALISSPFERAKQTAETIAKTTGKQAEYSELFVERVKPTYINGKPYTDEKASGLWREWETSLYTPAYTPKMVKTLTTLFREQTKLLFFCKTDQKNLLLL